MIVLGGDVAPPGHAEGGDLGVRQIQVAHRAKVGGVLGVGERIAPLDIVEARLVEPGRDQQLVLEREIHPLALAAVAQRRVVNEDSCHGFQDRISAKQRLLDFVSRRLRRRFDVVPRLRHRIPRRSRPMPVDNRAFTRNDSRSLQLRAQTCAWTNSNSELLRVAYCEGARYVTSMIILVFPII